MSGERRIWVGRDHVDVDGETLAYLIDLLRQGGSVVRNKRGEVVYVTPMTDVSEKLRSLAYGTSEQPLPFDYTPDAEDRAVLRDAVNFWMRDVGRDKMPEPAVVLRDLLVSFPEPNEPPAIELPHPRSSSNGGA